MAPAPRLHTFRSYPFYFLDADSRRTLYFFTLYFPPQNISPCQSFKNKIVIRKVIKVGILDSTTGILRTQ